MSNRLILDSEEAKSVAVVHKTNQGFSGKDLWKLKQERPDLFNGPASTPAQGSGAPAIPQGFQRVPDVPGWLFNPASGVYLNNKREHFCRDPVTGQFYELNRGEDITASLSVRGDAAACSASQAASSRNVVINDLHRAASSMKLDLGHLDSPAAMFAVYDGRAQAGGPARAEAAAKGLHVKLLPRLAAYRGAWDEDRLQAAVTESIEILTQEICAEEGSVSVAVALLLGRQLTLASNCSAVCMLLVPEEEDGSCDNDLVAEKGGPLATRVVDLALHEDKLGVILTVDAIRSAGVTQARLNTLVRPHLTANRMKAACVALLGEAQKGGAALPLVAAGVRLSWAQQDGPVSKRARGDVAGPGKVRCRHILLRHATSQIAAGERVKKKSTRAAWEAEARMLEIFGEITRGDSSAFTAQCRSVSECDSALRGGELAGDLGWLDKDPAKNKKVPAPVIRAAFALAVGQLSDIVSSERGVHLILRTA